MTVKPLDPSALFTTTSADQVSFDTTTSLEPLDGFPAQRRATDAIQFAIGIRHEGYNLSTVGPPGSGRHSLVRTFLERETTRGSADSDWCYVYNLDQPHRSCTIRLPPGRAQAFGVDMRQLVKNLRGTIAAPFETEEYRARQAELK